MKADIPEHLPDIWGDEESLVRVFTNLIGNATKFTPEGGNIMVGVQPNSHYITVRISDTGYGIPSDKLSLLFEPFFKVKGQNERGSGSGLGLTFCKKIMESHQGDITVMSKEGEGTTFVLKFPVQMHTKEAS